MADRAIPAECAILGGGPAGAVLAWLLARRGHAVVLVDDGRGKGGAPRETVLAAARHGLERAGLHDLLAACATVDDRRHGAIWGGPELRFRADAEPGYAVDRRAFAAALRTAAAAAGAIVLAHSRLVSPLPAAIGGAAEVCTPNGAVAIHAQRWVVATGRAAGRCAGVRTLTAGSRTLAVSFAGTCPEGARIALVEAVPQGWWWWIGDGERGGVATLFCEPDEARAVGFRTLAAAARAAACGPPRTLDEVRIVQAGDATARLCTSEQCLLIGDAAATVDPLASQGIEKSMLAADHAAAVVAAGCVKPEWWPRLRALHAGFERGVFAAHRATAAAFLAQESRFPDAPFWRRRRPATRAMPAPAEFVNAPLRWHASIRCEHVLARTAAGIAEVPGLVCTDTGDACTRIGYVPTAPLWPLFATPATIAAATAAAGGDAGLFVLPPSAVQAALADLVRRGWLRPAPAASDAAGSR